MLTDHTVIYFANARFCQDFSSEFRHPSSPNGFYRAEWIALFGSLWSAYNAILVRKRCYKATALQLVKSGIKQNANRQSASKNVSESRCVVNVFWCCLRCSHCHIERVFPLHWNYKMFLVQTSGFHQCPNSLEATHSVSSWPWSSCFVACLGSLHFGRKTRGHPKPVIFFLKCDLLSYPTPQCKMRNNMKFLMGYLLGDVCKKRLILSLGCRCGLS